MLGARAIRVVVVVVATALGPAGSVAIALVTCTVRRGLLLGAVSVVVRGAIGVTGASVGIVVRGLLGRPLGGRVSMGGRLIATAAAGSVAVVAGASKRIIVVVLAPAQAARAIRIGVTTGVIIIAVGVVALVRAV